MFSQFSSIFPSVTNKSGPFGFGLSGSGEAIRLFDNQGRIYYSVIYRDSLPWPEGADGQGYTLELLDPSADVCDGHNWFNGCLGGSPGGPYMEPCNTGIEEYSVNSFALFPVPATTQLFLRNKNAGNCVAYIRLMNVLGRTVLSENINFSQGETRPIELNGIAPGIYMIAIDTDATKQTDMFKIVIN